MKKVFLFLVASMMLTAPVMALAAPAGLNYLNGDANIVVHFDSKRLQQSQTFKDLMSMAMANPKAKSNLDDMKSKTGVDVLKDIDSVTAQIKAPKAPGSKAQVLGYVQGRFNAQSVVGAMKANKNEVKEVKASWGVMYQNPADASFSFAFISGGMLFGSTELVQNYKTGTFGGPLAKLAASFKDQAQDLWVVVDMNEEMRKDLGKKNPMMAQFVKVIGSLDFKPGLHLNIRATGESAAGPAQIAQMAQAQLAASTQSPQAAMFAGMIKKSSVTAQGNDLVLDVPLNQQDVNQIKMMVGMMLMSLQGGARPKGPAPKAVPVPTPAPKVVK